jgi:hypothetical protein
VLVVAGEVVKVAVATTPLLSEVLLRPKRRHVEEPELPLQDTDFPTATVAGPATTLTEVKSLAE